MFRLPFCLMFALLFLAAPAASAPEPFAGGWILQPAASTLTLQTVKNDTKVENSSFATFSGGISDQGLATITIALDSIDTKIDLRNVRMRFLMFETFTYPTATVTARIDAASLADLPAKRRMTLPLTFTLDLHGVAVERTIDASVTLLDDDTVAIASAAPIIIAAADHNMAEGVTKLEETAKVKIVPSGTITFDVLFKRATAAGPAPEPAAPATAALETTGNFDAEACIGRFEILSRAGNINFASASARLDASSGALLDTLLDVITRCPGMLIEVGGHTDNAGGDETNLALSQKRAASVIAYLAAKGVPAERLVAQGYGEAAPILPNDSAENMRRNRRIEFKVLSSN